MLNNEAREAIMDLVETDSKFAPQLIDDTWNKLEEKAVNKGLLALVKKVRAEFERQLLQRSNLGEVAEQLYSLDRKELRRLAWEALLISDGPDRIEGDTSKAAVDVQVQGNSFLVTCEGEEFSG